MVTILDRERTVAGPGFSRWLIPPAALAIHLCIGQAYATISDGRRSIDSFMLALNDPYLPADQRAFARDNIARIKKRTGL